MKLYISLFCFTWMVRDQMPKPPFDLLDKTLHVEPRKPGFGKFFDSSKTKRGYQSIQNRLALKGEVKDDWMDRLTYRTRQFES